MARPKRQLPRWCCTLIKQLFMCGAQENHVLLMCDAVLALLRQLACLLNGSIPWGGPVCPDAAGLGIITRLRVCLHRTGLRLSWIWRIYLRSPCCKAMALICAVMSASILWSEVRSVNPRVPCCKTLVWVSTVGTEENWVVGIGTPKEVSCKWLRALMLQLSFVFFDATFFVCFDASVEGAK